MKPQLDSEEKHSWTGLVGLSSQDGVSRFFHYRKSIAKAEKEERKSLLSAVSENILLKDWGWVLLTC